MIKGRKLQIEQSFGDHCYNYDAHASVQKHIAQKLCDYVDMDTPRHILEIGCGTGFLTEALLDKFPKAQITAIDISDDMIRCCRDKFNGVNFHVMDGEDIQLEGQFDLIISSMTVQWFDDPLGAIEDIKKYLTPQGQFYFSTIGQENFWEWRAALKELGLNDGLLEIPDYPYIFTEDFVTKNYEQTQNFLESMKAIGADTPRAGYKKLSAKQIKQACAHCDNTHQGDMTWHILYGKV